MLNNTKSLLGSMILDELATFEAKDHPKDIEQMHYVSVRIEQIKRKVLMKVEQPKKLGEGVLTNFEL